MQSIIGSSLPANLVLQRGVKEYPFTIPLILSVEVGTLICVWLYSEEPNTHSPCGSN